MEHGEIETRLRGLLAKQSEVSVDVSAVDSATKIEDIGFDSVSILDFMYEIESELDVEARGARPGHARDRRRPRRTPGDEARGVNVLSNAWYRVECAIVQALLWVLAQLPPPLLAAIAGCLGVDPVRVEPDAGRVAIANIGRPASRATAGTPASSRSRPSGRSSRWCWRPRQRAGA